MTTPSAGRRRLSAADRRPGARRRLYPAADALHAEWTIRALRAGKPVLCEKPLTGSLAGTEQVLAVARETGTPLWEAFVFPFHDQMRRLRALIADGVIGELREIQSNFHFLMTRRDTNIRMSAGVCRWGAPRCRLLPGPARPRPVCRRAHQRLGGRGLRPRRC